MAQRARKAAIYGGAVAVLLAVFALYTRPDMMVALGDLVWACFN